MKKRLDIDNASMLFTAMEEHPQNLVCMCARLTVKIDGEILKRALVAMRDTHKEFFMRLHRGFLKYKLEYSDELPVIIEGKHDTTHGLPKGGRLSTIYYEDKTISLVYFHVLGDGSSGMRYFDAIIGHYLAEAGLNESARPEIVETHEYSDASAAISKQDYGAGERKIQPDKRAFKAFDGKKPLKIDNIAIDAKAFYDKAKSYGNYSVNNYLVAVLMSAMAQLSSEHGNTKYPLVMQTSVNMRKKFGVDTYRNCVGSIKLNFACDSDDISEIIASAAEQQERWTSRDNMLASVKHTVGMAAGAARIVPRAIKSFAVRNVFKHIVTGGYSASLTNLGIIKPNDEIKPFIENYYFDIGVPINNTIACCASTYNGVMSLLIYNIGMDNTFSNKVIAILEREGVLSDDSKKVVAAAKPLS